MNEKSNVLKFPGKDQSTEQVPLEHEIQFIGLAIAYYVHCGRLSDARKLVSFLCQSPMLLAEMTLPPALAVLVEDADYGYAMYPPEPES